MRSLIALSVVFLLSLGCQSQAGSEPSSSERSRYSGKPIPAPDFALTGLDGKSFKLSEQKGKVVFLDFWATWCPPCVMSVPEVRRLEEKYPDIQVVSISLDTSDEPVREFAARNKVGKHMLLARESGVDQRYRVESIPSFFLIDKNGNLVRIWRGFSPDMGGQWAQSIDALLKQ